MSVGTQKAWIEDGRIVIPSRFKEENMGFLRSLPEARWSKARRVWSCLATSVSLDRVVEKFGQIDGHEANGTTTHEAKWLTDPWQHQKDAFYFFVGRDAGMVGLDMGTGKTKVAIDLLASWDSQRVLILCPKSVLNVWPREFVRHSAEPFEVVVLDKGSTLKKVAEAEKAFLVHSEKRIAVVVNYETAWRKEFAAWSTSQSWCAVVCDESHRIKSPSGKSSKYCFAVGKRAKRRLCLTGTPMPHSPLDVFGQYRFLDAGIFGTSYTLFRSRYAITNQMFPSQIDQWINEDELKDKFHSIAQVVKSEDVLDLPDAMHETRVCELSPKAARIYRDLEQDLIAEVESGVITVDNALVKLLRLQQITSGYVRDDDENILDVDTSKQDMLKDVLTDLPLLEPVVVFAKFRHDLDRIRDVAESLGRRYGEVSGRQKDLTNEATMPAGIELLGVQIQAGGVGIDLTRACYCVYYSLGYSLGDYLQSIKRVHRPGQTRPVRYYHLLASGTVDHAVYRALDKRQAVITSVLEKLGDQKYEHNH